jgi:hypothetical protein
MFGFGGQLHDTVSTLSRVSYNGYGAGLNNPQPGWNRRFSADDADGADEADSAGTLAE